MNIREFHHHPEPARQPDSQSLTSIIVAYFAARESGAGLESARRQESQLIQAARNTARSLSRENGKTPDYRRVAEASCALHSLAAQLRPEYITEPHTRPQPPRQPGASLPDAARAYFSQPDGASDPQKACNLATFATDLADRIFGNEPRRSKTCEETVSRTWMTLSAALERKPAP